MSTATQPEKTTSPKTTATRPPRPRTPHVPGVTYRQLDWWVKRGYLKPGREREKGQTGNFRIWPAEEVRVAEDIGRLRKVGVALPKAAEMARQGRAGVQALLDALKLLEGAP